jgi:DNA-binding NarL/FixJ family response regulator
MGINVFIADDHGVVRDGLRFLMEAQEDIEIVGESSDGFQAVRRVESLHPDVVIMDISMPRLNGIDATAFIRQQCPSAQVIILSMHVSTEHIYRALKAGARGYLIKESAGQEVVDAIRIVHAGHRYLSTQINETVIEDYIALYGTEQPVKPLEKLSLREREIMQMVVEGNTSEKIAGLLYLSPKTVETYRSRMMQKLDIKDMPTLVKFAIKQGIASLE